MLDVITCSADVQGDRKVGLLELMRRRRRNNERNRPLNRRQTGREHRSDSGVYDLA